MAICAKSIADGGGAAALPDDGVGYGPSCGALPCEDGLALVGDGDAGDVSGASDTFTGRIENGLPDEERILLDEVWLWMKKPERRRCSKYDFALAIDEKSLGIGRALIDGEDEAHSISRAAASFSAEVSDAEGCWRRSRAARRIPSAV